MRLGSSASRSRRYPRKYRQPKGEFQSEIPANILELQKGLEALGARGYISGPDVFLPVRGKS